MRGTLVMLSVLAMACAQPASLVVSVRSDFAPGREVDSVVTKLLTGGSGAGEVLRTSHRGVTQDDGLAEGLVVAELDALEPGTYRVALELELEGDRVAAQTVVVDVERDRSVLVLVTRDCAGVTCGADDPASAACLAGSCVDTECVIEGAPTTCADECATAADCPALSGCAVPSCEAGACFYTADDAACGAGGRCDVERGCRGLEDGLVAWYRFEGDLEAGLVDASGNGVDGACRADECPTTVAGPVGAAASFDGVDDHYRVPHQAVLEATEGLTVSLWLTIADFDPPGLVQAIQHTHGSGVLGSFELYFHDWDDSGNEEITFAMSDADILDRIGVAPPFAPGEWAHVAGRWDGATMEIWVDGERMGSRPHTGPPRWDSHEMTVGSDLNRDVEYVSFWNGALDEIRIYDRALTDEEIRLLAMR